ncbi:DUF4398 domain-containing protein [Gilvimarinus sp. SDUM040013]|uniref:DUF4398 domain-containing protein n=1 Tax=Gilvimarinus gilvus TaxID=3058038 RepID=A0ABU4S5I2_9GAMM|nr:DUF4398 domain-containing protein [Gilvimarinus sp. SDUM040013]MDO3385860.1 DUF4398 domain-containing protein [Gilvimarinus sp. SDUM040013]MDX6851153.1 DUF4398 domain-containing protein [Gilvimarinus sp. SDUM040013]
MKQVLALLSSLAFVIVVTGCASGVAKPDSMLAQAQSRIEQARSVDADRHAPVIFRDAQKNYEMANDLIAQEEYEKARDYLERSISDANLAIATSNAEKSSRASKQVQDNLRALEREVK